MLVPGSGNLTHCNVTDSLTNITDSLQSIFVLLQEAASVDPLNIQPDTGSITAMQGDTSEYVKTEAIVYFISYLPKEVEGLLSVLSEEGNSADLNRYFSKAESTANADEMKGLLLDSNMSKRVDAEMHIKSIVIAPGLTVKEFDPAKYPVIYNAIVMAKLALLDNIAFNQLAASSGSTSYSNSDYSNKYPNLIAGAFANIDGNHQWMPKPPPLANTKNSYPPVTHSYASTDGFLLWQEDMRETIFRKLFIGPLTPGLTATDFDLLSNSLKFLSGKYPYKSCSMNAFPDDINDNKCSLAYLIPIWTLLLN